jgi:hypothetical protein
MPKKSTVKVEGNTISGTAEDIIDRLKSASKKFKKLNGNGHHDTKDEDGATIKAIEIKSARLKEGFCNYSYEMMTGPTAGDSVNRSGASIIHDDMRVAFAKLKPHLAMICEEVDAAKITDISDYESLDVLEDYKKNSIEAKVVQFTVTGIQLEGSGENESVQLTGVKRLSTLEDLHLKTPRVKWEGAYPFVHELRAIIDELKSEVEQYMNGKAAPVMVQQDLFVEDKSDAEE